MTHGKTIPEIADAAAEAVRTLNHSLQAALPHGQASAGLEYPGDAYTTVAALKVLAYRLPQSAAQIHSFIKNLHADGRLTADHDTVTNHVARLDDAITDAVTAAQALGSALDHAHTALGPLGYTD